MARSLVQHWEKPLTREKSKNGRTRNPKLENARRLRGIYFIDPGDGEYTETIKDARRKLEVPMVAAMPYRKGTKKHSGLQETEAKSDESNKIPKTKHTRIVEVHESTRQRLESSLPKDHEDDIAGKGKIRWLVTNWCTFFPMPRAMNIPDAKAAADKELLKLETIPAWQLDTVKSKKEVFLEAHRDKKKVHLATLMDICHLKKCGVRTKKSKYKGTVVLRGTLKKTTLEPAQSLLNRARLRQKRLQQN